MGEGANMWSRRCILPTLLGLACAGVAWAGEASGPAGNPPLGLDRGTFIWLIAYSLAALVGVLAAGLIAFPEAIRSGIRIALEHAHLQSIIQSGMNELTQNAIGLRGQLELTASETKLEIEKSLTAVREEMADTRRELDRICVNLRGTIPDPGSVQRKASEDAAKGSIIEPPPDADLHMRLRGARRLALSGRTNEAQAAYASILAEQATCLDALLDLAELEIRDNQYASAAEHLAAALVVDPTDLQITYRLGVALYYDGKYAEARDALQRCLNLDGPMPYLFLGLTYWKLEKWDEAIAETRICVDRARFISDTRTLGKALNNLAYFLLEKATHLTEKPWSDPPPEDGSLKEATDAIEEALSLESNVPTQDTRGCILIWQGHYRDAFEALNSMVAEATKLGRNRPLYYEHINWALSLMKRFGDEKPKP